MTGPRILSGKGGCGRSGPAIGSRGPSGLPGIVESCLLCAWSCIAGKEARMSRREVQILGSVQITLQDVFVAADEELVGVPLMTRHKLRALPGGRKSDRNGGASIDRRHCCWTLNTRRVRYEVQSDGTCHDVSFFLRLCHTISDPRISYLAAHSRDEVLPSRPIVSYQICPSYQSWLQVGRSSTSRLSLFAPTSGR